MNSNNTLHNVFMSARQSLTRMVSRIVPPKEIEDIVQETYVRICQIDNRETIKQPRSFLLKTAKNLAIDHIKRAESQLVDSADETPELLQFNLPEDAIFQQVASDEEFGQFCEAVRLLPVQCRKVFILKKVYGYSQKEIAQQLDLSQSTVEKHIALGIKRCTYFMMNKTQSNSNDSAHQSKAKGAGHE